MKDFFNKFEEAMESAAYAEAGEHDTAREIIAKGKNSNKKVLLGTQGAEVDDKAFLYAVNLCRRMGAQLEILHILKPFDPERSENLEDLLSKARRDMAPVFEKLTEEGIGYSLNFGVGWIEEEVVKYSDGRSDIALVVVHPPEGTPGKRAAFERKINEALDRLKCPLVVVSEPV